MTLAASSSTRLGRWKISTQVRQAGKGGEKRLAQVHGSQIVWAHEAGRNSVGDGLALWYDFPRPCLITTADCLPLVLVSDRSACLLHVSRKTLVRGLLEQVPEFILPIDMKGAWIGPHICGKHFVFEYLGEEAGAFCAKYPWAAARRRDGWHLDLQAVTLQYLYDWGLGDKNIKQDGRCTFEAIELPSYRRGVTHGQSTTAGIATVVESMDGLR